MMKDKNNTEKPNSSKKKLHLFGVCALHEQCTHHRRSVKMSNLQILLKIPIVRG